MDEGMKLGYIKFALNSSKQCREVISQAFKDNPKLTAEQAFQELDRRLGDLSVSTEKDKGGSYLSFEGVCFSWHLQ